MAESVLPSMVFGGAPVNRRPDAGPRFPLLTNAEAWARLPAAASRNGQPLPSWARMLTVELPRGTAALLQLDLAHRTKSPVAPALRASMRWVAAHANRCPYAQAEAAADARRAGLDDARLAALGHESFPGWSEADRAALEFARKMTAESDEVTDAEFAALVAHFGAKQAAAMVLLLAYANFQDRLLLCLGAPMEPAGPIPPVDVSFASEAFVVKTTPPAALDLAPLPEPTGADLLEDDPAWRALSYDALQERLETQRRKPTRLPIPSWDEVACGLPEGVMQKPSDIVWLRICMGYAPELAVPFEVLLRTVGAELSPRWDRLFAVSLFWVTTRAMQCPYCMGHCEMNWEVAGLSQGEIARRSRILAGDDWSSYAPAEQHALAFARTLTQSPWAISGEEIEMLKRELGPDRALFIAFTASRYHYMTRISNGFQLTLERENVFFDYYGVKRPTGEQRSSAP
jgi:alkylhydroperoxidase family enzyme